MQLLGDALDNPGAVDLADGFERAFREARGSMTRSAS